MVLQSSDINAVKFDITILVDKQTIYLHANVSYFPALKTQHGFNNILYFRMWIDLKWNIHHSITL
jgi:hypothetical protein